MVLLAYLWTGVLKEEPKAAPTIEVEKEINAPHAETPGGAQEPPTGTSNEVNIHAPYVPPPEATPRTVEINAPHVNIPAGIINEMESEEERLERERERSC